MIRLFAACLILLGLTFRASAQSPYPGYADMDINNLSARSLVHGDQWWEPGSGMAACEYPKGSGKHVGFAAGLWLSAYNDTNGIHTSVCGYRQNGVDFWPGPFDTSSNSFQRYTNAGRWAKVWSIDRATLDSYFVLSQRTIFNIPQAILTWPALGNIYAKDANGDPITISRAMAPFVDADGDGRYNALYGDHPALIGDKMFWWITNDAGVSHTASGPGSRPLGLEIVNRAWAFRRGTAADDIIFYDHTFTNYSPRFYDSLRLGIWADLNLGARSDDYLGFDTVHRMAYLYNGRPGDSVYGSSIPAAAVTLLYLPGDAPGAAVAAGTYNFYDTGINGAPQTPVGYKNLMQGKMTGGGFSPRLPLFKSPLYECLAADDPGDRRFILNSSGRRLLREGSTRLAYALLAAPAAGGCPGTSLAGLMERADTAWRLYRQTAAGIAAAKTAAGWSLYPNPASESVFVKGTGTNAAGLPPEIYDAAGRKMAVAFSRQSDVIRLDVRALPAGLYFLHVDGGVQKFIKE